MDRNRRLRELLDGASWEEALSSPRTLRRRIILAEVLAPPVTMRDDVRDLRMRPGRAADPPR